MAFCRVHLLNERSTLMHKYLREQPKAAHSARPLLSLNRQVLGAAVTLALQPNQLLSYYHASDCDKDTSVNTLRVSSECQLTSQCQNALLSQKALKRSGSNVLLTPCSEIRHCGFPITIYYMLTGLVLV